MHGLGLLVVKRGSSTLQMLLQTWPASPFSGVASVSNKSTVRVHRSVPGGKQIMVKLSRYLHGIIVQAATCSGSGKSSVGHSSLRDLGNYTACVSLWYMQQLPASCLNNVMRCACSSQHEAVLKGFADLLSPGMKQSCGSLSLNSSSCTVLTSGPGTPACIAGLGAST